MPYKINNIHDKFFKSMMNDLDIAKDFLDSFLPSDVIDIIDMESISHAKTDFLLHDLKEVFSDVVFDCKLKDDNNAYISIVLEHKSRPDKFTAIQLLLYLAHSYYQQAKTYKEIRPIIPLVFYHGKEKWEYKPLTELIEGLPIVLKQYIPIFNTLFVDLSNFTDDNLNSLGSTLLSSALMLQKYSSSPLELENKIQLIFKKLDSIHNRNFLRTIFVYTLQFTTVSKVKNVIMNLSPAIQEEFESGANTLIKQGMQQGIEKGIEKEKTLATKNLILEGFDNQFIAKILHVSDEFINNLR